MNITEIATDFSYWKIAATILLVLFAIAQYQTRSMKFTYNVKDKLMKEFVEKSNIRNIKFRPYFLCLEPFGQTVFLIALEALQKALWKNNTEIELVKTPDGATLGIEWSIDDGVGKPPTADEHASERKPILLLASGL